MYPLRISCVKATTLMEKKIHFGLTPSESVRLHLHTAICSTCRAYEQQSLFMEQLFRASIQTPFLVPSVTDEEASLLADRILKK